MTITLKSYGAAEYKKGLNVRYMSEPFYIDGNEIIFECGHHTKGKTVPTIYETDEHGTTRGNSSRMEKAGFWERYDYGYKVIVDNLPEYSKSGIIEALIRIYPEIANSAPRFVFID